MSVIESEEEAPASCSDCRFVRIGFKETDEPETARLEPEAKV